MDQVRAIKINREPISIRITTKLPVLQVLRDVHYGFPNIITNDKHPFLVCPYDKENMVVDDKYTSFYVGTMYVCPECGFHDNVYVVDEDRLVKKLKTREEIWSNCGEEQMTISDYHEKMGAQCGGVITYWDQLWMLLQMDILCDHGKCEQSIKKHPLKEEKE